MKKKSHRQKKKLFVYYGYVVINPVFHINISLVLFLLCVTCNLVFALHNPFYCQINHQISLMFLFITITLYCSCMLMSALWCCLCPCQLVLAIKQLNSDLKWCYTRNKTLCMHETYTNVNLGQIAHVYLSLLGNWVVTWVVHVTCEPIRIPVRILV